MTPTSKIPALALTLCAAFACVPKAGDLGLLTDATTAYIKYIKRIIGPSDWSPLFKNAMAAHLAMLLAMPITKSASMMQAMAQLYEARLSEAYSVDTQEGTPDLIDSNEIIDVR